MNIEKLRAVWDEHARVLHAYLLKLTRSESDARDYLQDIFHRLAREPDLIDRLNGETRPYLVRFARNLVVDQARRNTVRDRILGGIEIERRGEFAPAEDPDTATVRAALLHALAHLPEDQRAVVHARLWKRRTLEEISREAGISINTAASRYRYGIDKMRGELRELYEDLATRPSSKTKTNMKSPDKKTAQEIAPEPPIIQPLEQRRVPSATGAFALPVLPVPDEAGDHEVAVDEVNADVSLDEPLPPGDIDLTCTDFLANFDAFAGGIDGGEVDPNVILGDIFADGEPLPIDGIGDGEPLQLDGIGDGEPLPIDGIGDGTEGDGEAADPGDGNLEDPNVIYYSTGGVEAESGPPADGGGVESQSGAPVEAEPVAFTPDIAAQSGAPITGVDPHAVEHDLAVALDGAQGQPFVADFSSHETHATPEPIHLPEIHDAAPSVAAEAHEFAAIGSAHHDATAPDVHDDPVETSDHGTAMVDQWVPLHDESANADHSPDASTIALRDTQADDDAHTDHDAPSIADVAAGGSLRHIAATSALAGTVLFGRENGVRRKS